MGGGWGFIGVFMVQKCVLGGSVFTQCFDFGFESETSV